MSFVIFVSLSSSSSVILEIAVDRHNEKGVFVASQILLALHAIVETQAKMPWFRFEIVHIKGRIRFFFIIDREYRGLLEGQLYAHYPNIEITEVSDFTTDKTVFLTARTSLASYSVDIIKLYTNLKDKTEKESVDPLSSLTSALSKTPKDDISLFHIDFSPISDSYWRTDEKIAILSSSLSDRKKRFFMHAPWPIRWCIAPFRWTWKFLKFFFGVKGNEAEIQDGK